MSCDFDANEIYHQQQKRPISFFLVCKNHSKAVFFGYYHCQPFHAQSRNKASYENEAKPFKKPNQKKKISQRTTTIKHHKVVSFFFFLFFVFYGDKYPFVTVFIHNDSTLFFSPFSQNKTIAKKKIHVVLRSLFYNVFFSLFIV